MKHKLSLFLLSCALAIPASAQDAFPEATKKTLEYVELNGSLVRLDKEFYELDEVKDFTFEVAIVTNADSRQSSGFLRISSEYADRHNTDTDVMKTGIDGIFRSIGGNVRSAMNLDAQPLAYSSALQADELPQVLQMLQYATDSLFASPHPQYSEIAFKSRANVTIGIYNDDGIWMLYVCPTPETDRATAQISAEEHIGKFRQRLKSAQEIIARKTKK